MNGASKYWVFKTEGHAGCDLGKALIAEVAGTSYVDSEVADGRSYFYTVIAVGNNDTCFGVASSCPSDVGAFSDYQTGPGEIIPPSTYQDTWVSDDVHEVLKETKTMGDARLSHTWLFDDLPSGSHELVIEGWRTDLGEGDDFEFSSSTDGVLFSLIPDAVIDNEMETPGGESYPFGGSSLSGTVFIKVEDTDPEGPKLDTLSIDYLAIRLAAAP